MVFRALTILFVFASGGLNVSVSVAADDGSFSVDRQYRQLARQFGYFLVDDLGVGESGFVRGYSDLCRHNDRLFISRSVRLSGERNKYSNYLRVTRLPNNAAALEFVDSSGEVVTDKEDLKEFLVGIILFYERYDCIEFYRDFEGLVIRSINGANSVTSLIEYLQVSGLKLDEENREISEASSGEDILETLAAWSVSEEPSPIDDAPNLYIRRYGTDTADYKSIDFSKVILIRCRDHELESYFSFDEYFFETDDKVKITYRFDKLAAKSDRWNLSTDNKAVFVPGSIKKWIWWLVRHDNLYVRVEPSRDSFIDANFDLSGLSEHIAVLAKSCDIAGWDVTRKEVVFIQQYLATAGYAPGTADGVIGAKTRAAVRAFEKDQGLPETGVINANLLSLIRSKTGDTVVVTDDQAGR